MTSKNGHGLSALFAALILARAQDVTPPVPIHQIEPEWSADLSKGYLEDRTQVEMIVDAEGIPYALKGSLPDNVVMALSQWRFQPGKKDGRAAAFNLVIKVPVRRTINPDIERSFERRGAFLSKELTDAIKAGAELDAAGAATAQQSLAADAKNINARATLLAYYANAKGTNSDELRKARLEQIAWLVQNAPESNLCASPLAQINALGEPLRDPPGYAQVRELWLQQVSSNPDNAGILAGAADFLKIADPEKAVELRMAVNKNANLPSLLGEYYALAALGVTGLDLQRGIPASATDKMPETPFAQKARSTLTSTSDGSLLMVGLATVTIAGKSLAKTGHLPAGYSEFCDALLNKAKQLQPAITTSCDPTGPLPEHDNAPTRLRIGGNVQAANLVKKVQPAYPAEAKSRHIQGTVQFTAIIDKTGKISTLTLASGPLALYESARDAVRQWVYKPTLLNGQPVEVVTQLDVNYVLNR
jgi:TonB family protein